MAAQRWRCRPQVQPGDGGAARYGQLAAALGPALLHEGGWEVRAGGGRLLLLLPPGADDFALMLAAAAALE